MSLIGKEITDFKVQAYLDGQFEEVTKESILGKWSVFFFYPADFTFVWPTELGDLADYHDKFKQIGCEIYSISTDTHFVHKAWADISDTIKKIKYPMLADPTHALSNDFGVLISEEGISLRGTFIINPEGKIISYEINDLPIGRNVVELLRKVTAAKYVAENKDQAVQAGWQPGELALTPSIDLIGKL